MAAQGNTTAIGLGSGSTRLTGENNDRGYEPGNMRWATRSEQRRNRRLV